jgi:hypothetical protein
MSDVLSFLDAAFPKPDIAGRRTHDVFHPALGKIDTIFVSGSESPEELAAYESPVISRHPSATISR